jgi:hypothetical protein
MGQRSGSWSTCDGVDTGLDTHQGTCMLPSCIETSRHRPYLSLLAGVWSSGGISRSLGGQRQSIDGAVEINCLFRL